MPTDPLLLPDEQRQPEDTRYPEELAAAPPTDSKRWETRSATPETIEKSPTPAAQSGIDFLAPAQADDEIGRLGPYRVLKVLGKGGMGLVLLAEDVQLKRRVALKVMRPEIATNESARRRFLREAQAAAAVQHDCIIAIYHVGEDRGVPYLVMPCLRGETLADRLRRDGKLPPEETWRIAREIAQGLAAAHERGLIHRDIKPSNIWLECVGNTEWEGGKTCSSDPQSPMPESQSPRVKILDFGLARVSEGAEPDTAITQSGAIIGTPAYMAPEQADGKIVDPRADLFSFGCVLYQMQTGTQPFKGPSMMSIISALANHHPTPPSTLDPAVSRPMSDLVMQLLAKDPAARPESARSVVQILNGIGTQSPVAYPILRDTAPDNRALAGNLEVVGPYRATALAGTGGPTVSTAGSWEEADAYYWKLVHASDRAAQEGNAVRAAILRRRAAREAPLGRGDATHIAAIAQLLGLIDRLTAPLTLSAAEIENWRKHLPALLEKADESSRTHEAALLYDLQTVCVDHERETYSLDLTRWAQSGGRGPIARPLPCQRLLRIARTLRTTPRRLAKARLEDEDRVQLANLLQAAVQRSEDQVRQRFRSLLTSALHDVGLNPRDPVDSIAFAKVVNEIMDRIIASGFITFSELRDTLSRNGLKLPDLIDPQYFIRGDPLLRLDRRLRTLLDGVYRPSEFYLRLVERCTVLSFGTRLGRLLTSYVTLPFLGAFLILEVAEIGLYWLIGSRIPREVYYPAGAALVFFVLALLRAARARRHARLVGAVPRPLSAGVPDAGTWLGRHALVNEAIASWPFQFLWWYLFLPLGLAGVVTIFLPLQLILVHVPELLFVAAVFFINSRSAQAGTEHSVTVPRTGLIPALFNRVKVFFQHLLRQVHQCDALLFRVEQWIQLRSGDSRPTMIARALLSLAWFPVAYVIRFNFVVLIEPCLNPLKLPIASIATKAMLPLLPIIKNLVSDACVPALGGPVGELIAFWIMFWLPDVFGFLCWEMKENWSLYRANSRNAQEPVTLGGNGGQNGT